MPRGRFSVEAIFKARDRFSRPIAKMSRGVGRFARRANRHMATVNRMTDRVVRGFKRVGVAAGAMAVGAGAALLSVGRTGADFEQAITNVGAVTLKSREQIAALEEQALALGASTKFTATEVANAMEIMARAGFDTEQIMAGVPGVLDAAAASGMEIADVADVVSNALKGMGLEASDATKVADILALASSKTNSTIGSLGESMKNVASTARQLEIPIEDVVAAVASLQDVGLDASVAGSALNTMLTKLAAPSDSLRAKFKEMGIAFEDAHGNALPFQQILANLAEGAKQSGGNMKQVAFLAELVGLRGQKAASNLKDLLISGKLQKLTESLKGASGAAKAMADIRMDTTKGDLLKLEAAIDGVKTALFDTQAGPLRGMIQGMTKWVEANKEAITSGLVEFVEWLSTNMPTIVDVLTRIGKAFAVFATAATLVKLVTGAIAVFNAVMALNPVVAVGIAIVAALAAIVAFWPEISAFFTNVWDGMVELAKAIVSTVTGLVKAATAPVLAFVRAVGEFIAGMFKLAFLPLWPLIQLARDAFAQLVAWVIEKWQPIGAFFGAIWQSITETFTAAMAILGALVDFAVQAFMDKWTPIAAFFGGLLDTVRGIFSAFFGWVAEKVGGVLSTVGKVVDAVRAVGRISLGDLVGGGDSDGEGAQGGSVGSDAGVTPQVQTPQERITRSITETSRTTKGEVTIRDESGRAQITKQPKGAAALRLRPSGAFG